MVKCLITFACLTLSIIANRANCSFFDENYVETLRNENKGLKTKLKFLRENCNANFFDVAGDQNAHERSHQINEKGIYESESYELDYDSFEEGSKSDSQSNASEGDEIEYEDFENTDGDKDESVAIESWEIVDGIEIDDSKSSRTKDKNGSTDGKDEHKHKDEHGEEKSGSVEKERVNSVDNIESKGSKQGDSETYQEFEDYSGKYNESDDIKSAKDINKTKNGELQHTDTERDDSNISSSDGDIGSGDDEYKYEYAESSGELSKIGEVESKEGVAEIESSDLNSSSSDGDMSSGDGEYEYEYTESSGELSKIGEVESKKGVAEIESSDSNNTSSDGVIGGGGGENEYEYTESSGELSEIGEMESEKVVDEVKSNDSQIPSTVQEKETGSTEVKYGNMLENGTDESKNSSKEKDDPKSEKNKKDFIENGSSIEQIESSDDKIKFGHLSESGQKINENEDDDFQYEYEYSSGDNSGSGEIGIEVDGSSGSGEEMSYDYDNEHEGSSENGEDESGDDKIENGSAEENQSSSNSSVECNNFLQNLNLETLLNGNCINENVDKFFEKIQDGFKFPNIDCPVDSELKEDLQKCKRQKDISQKLEDELMMNSEELIEKIHINKILERRIVKIHKDHIEVITEKQELQIENYILQEHINELKTLNQINQMGKKRKLKLVSFCT